MTPDQKHRMYAELGSILLEANEAALRYHQAIAAASAAFQASQQSMTASLRKLGEKAQQAEVTHQTAKGMVRQMADEAQRERSSEAALQSAAHKKEWAEITAACDDSPEWEQRAGEHLLRFIEGIG